MRDGYLAEPPSHTARASSPASPDGSPPSASFPLTIPPGASPADLRIARDREKLCESYKLLTIDGVHSGNMAARVLRKSPSWFSGSNSMYARWQRDGLAGLLPKPRPAPAKPKKRRARHCRPRFNLPEFGDPERLETQIYVLRSILRDSANMLPVDPGALRRFDRRNLRTIILALQARKAALVCGSSPGPAGGAA